jgi:hypothetical protein
VHEACTLTTRLCQTLLCPNRHISIWCGSHTLARGRIWREQRRKHLKETQITPPCILLSHLHPHQTKLQHLRTRTPSSNQSSHSLETLPCLDQETLHHPNRPCQPPILEISMKTQWMNSQMAQFPPRLQIQDRTHPRQTTCSSRCPIKTSQCRPWPRQQWSNDHDPRISLYQSCRWGLTRKPQKPHCTNPELPSIHHESMGSMHTPTTPPNHWQTHVENPRHPETSNTTRPRPISRNHENMAWPTNCRTPWKRWNCQVCHTPIPLARRLPMDRKLHQRMCNMSTSALRSSPKNRKWTRDQTRL